MSTIINLASQAFDYEGQQQIESVDVPLQVAIEWRLAKAGNYMATIRQCVYEVHPDGHGHIHWKSPRTVKEVTTIFVNPDWIYRVEEGHYSETTKKWRDEDKEGMLK